MEENEKAVTIKVMVIIQSKDGEDIEENGGNGNDEKGKYREIKERCCVLSQCSPTRNF